METPSGRPMCRCNEECSESGSYVCATDNKITREEHTFRNECYMNKTACKEETTYTVKHDGRCPTPPKKGIGPKGTYLVDRLINAWTFPT